jgi:uncharacterized protein with GYD domain
VEAFDNAIQSKVFTPLLPTKQYLVSSAHLEPWEEPEMPTFLMLTNLTAEGVRTLKNHPGRIAEVNREVEQMGVKVVSQYATLGQYDFVTVVEAPDEKTMAKVSVELGSRGTMTSQTLAALPAEDLSSSL